MFKIGRKTMKIISMKKRELLDLCSVLIISITFTLFSLSIGLIDRMYNFFYAFTSLPIAEFLINIIFLWLAGLLWITYRRWNEAVKRQRELENIISSINPDVLIVVDRNRNIIMCNATVKSMFGYDIDEVVNQKTDFLYSDRRSNPLQKHEISAKLERIGFHSGFADGKKKNGDIILLEIITAKLRGREGVVLLIKNITNRKLAEKELEETKDHLNNIIESSLDPIVTTDCRGYVTKVNRSFLKLLGLQEEKVIGKHMADFSPIEEGTYRSTADELVEINEEFFDNIKTFISELVEEGKIFNWDSYLIRNDKKVIPVEENIVYFYNKEGEKTGAVGIIRDITERKRSEKEIREAKEFLENLFKTSNDAILVTDPQGNITMTNNALEKMVGYSRDELLGEHSSLLSPLDDRIRSNASRNMEILFKEGSIYGHEMVWQTKDGQHIFVELNLSLIKDKNGEVIGGVNFIRDVTDRKKIEQQLVQTEKLKSLGELAGGVAHDFNNVLAAILGRAQLLKMTVDSPPKGREKRKSVNELKKGLEIIEKASKDGAETVRRIQEFARRRDDDKYFNLVDINEVINTALEFTRARWKDEAESKGIIIKIQKIVSPLPSIAGNASELREVLTNIINNALDALPKGGDIKIETSKRNDHICIIVGDTGVGIPRTIKDRIFDPFFTTKGVQSSGLGLSVSYGIIKRHRGTITVDSVEGGGTTFTIKLPILKKEVKEDEIKFIAQDQKKARILVIEDEDEVRDLLYDILTDAGHEVEIAFDGMQGIELFDRGEFDLVFTDLGMPVMSGWQVAEKIKGINGKVPVALITGWNLDIKKSDLKKSDIDLIIQKPFEVDQVIKLVQEGMLLRERFKAA